MPFRHLIRWFADGRSEWLAQSRDGAVVQGPAPGLPTTVAEHTVLLLPAEDVLLLEAPRVARSSAQLAQALPFAIEEAMVAAVEGQHVAFADPADGERIPVAVVERERLRAILATLAAAGQQPDAAYSEAQCLPWVDGQPLWLQDHDRVLLRFGRSAALVAGEYGQALDLDWLARVGIAPASLRRLRVADMAGEGEVIAVPLLAWFAAHLPDAQSPNLLQGAFAPLQRRAAARGRWKLAAGLAACALLSALGALLAERQALERHVQARQFEMESLLRRALPSVQRVVDPVAQMRAALRSGQAGGADALALLGRIAPILNGGSQLVLEAVEYRGGSLELLVTGPDVATLDSLRERIGTLPALSVELADATPGSRGVQGRLRIREGGT